jgi:nucleolin
VQAAVDSAATTASQLATEAKETVVNAAAAAFGTGRSEAGSYEEQQARTLYVGNYDYGVQESEIKQAFEGFGPIESLRFKVDEEGRGKGYVAAECWCGADDDRFSFIVYETLEAAEAAKAEMNGVDFYGRDLRVNTPTPREPREPSGQATTREPSTALFIGGLPRDVDDESIVELFRGCSAQPESVRINFDRVTGLPRGFAHADFDSVDTATKVHAELQGRRLGGRWLRIDFSGPPREGGAFRGGGGGGGGSGRDGFGRGGRDGYEGGRDGFGRGGRDGGRDNGSYGRGGRGGRDRY